MPPATLRVAVAVGAPSRHQGSSDLDGLRARADAGDYAAAELLTGLLADRGDLDALRARTDVGVA